MPRVLTAVVVSLSLVATSQAAPIDAAVDTSQSSVNVQLCMLGKCDTDSSPVAGWARVKLNPIIGPTSLTMCDFSFSLTQNINLSLTWTFPPGQITATGQNISMHFPSGQPPLPATTVTGGSFTYAAVPADKAGAVLYTATSTPCALLQASGKPCTDTINLADQGTSTGNMNGTVSVSPARAMTLTLYPSYSGPIDPNNPSLGTMTITGTVVCRATIPLRGDADLNGTINGMDIQRFISILLAPATFAWQDRFAVDMNDDDIFDLADVQLFVTCILEGGCGG